MTPSQQVQPAAGPPAPFDLSRLLETIPAPAALVDRERRVVGANGPFCARFGPARSCVGARCHELLHESDVACDLAGGCPCEECGRSNWPSRWVHAHSLEGRIVVEEVIAAAIGPVERASRLTLEVFRELDLPSPEPPGALVGRSIAMARLRCELVGLRSCHDPILVRGEPGTERELVARTLHALGPRGEGPFLALPCVRRGSKACVPPFAATGDHWATLRLREAAHDGTVFLDDVTTLPATSQEELFLNLSGTRRTWRASLWSELWGARWILGSARSPAMAAAQGDLLPELLPWVSGPEVVVPPVRERAGDVPLLVEALRPWLVAPPELEIDPAVGAALASLPLYGNLWELRRRLQDGVLNAGSGPLLPRHLVA